MENKQLTEFQEVEGGVIENLPSPDVGDILRDGKIEPPLGILERPYKIGTYTIASATPPFIIYPWQLLLTQPRIAEVLSNYEYMRSDVRIRVLLNAPITTYGTISMTPVFGNTTTTLATRGTTDQQMISYPGTMLADVSQRESMEIVIPYVSIFDNFPLHERVYYNGVYVCVWGLHSVLPDEATPTCSIEVYANFENTILNAPRKVPVPAPPLNYASGHMHLDPTRRFTAATVLGTIATTMGYTMLGEAISYMGTTSNIDRLPDVSEGIDNQPDPVRIMPWGNLVSNAYNNTGQYMSTGRYNSSPMKDLNGPNHSFNFYDLIKIPSFYDITSFAYNTSHIRFLRPEESQGYFRDVVKLFRRYRGGVKVMLRFVCCPLTVARFHISFDWSDTAVTATDEDISDRYAYVVSVQGTTTEYFTVPFINKAHWYISNGDKQRCPRITIRCVAVDTASSISTTSVPTIDVLTFVSAADDFVMQHPQSPFYFDSTEASGHMDLCSAFKVEKFQDVSGRPGRIIDPHDVKDLHEYFNRYSCADSGLYAPIVKFLPEPYYTEGIKYPDDPSVGALDWLTWYFALYTSGGRRFKVPVPTTQVDLVLQNTFTVESISATSMNILYEFTDGITRTYPDLQTVTEFEVPFICPYGVYPVWQPEQPPSGDADALEFVILPSVQIASVVDNPPDKSAIAVAAGHDYQLHILQPPTLNGVQIQMTAVPSPPPAATSGPRSMGPQLSSRRQKMQ